MESIPIVMERQEEDYDAVPTTDQNAPEDQGQEQVSPTQEPQTNHQSQFLENAPSHRVISTFNRNNNSDVDNNDAIGSATNDKFQIRPMSLTEYLYNKGFLEGSCSDVSFKAFGKVYNLHRLILHRSPYFSALFGTWDNQENTTTREINLDEDENITQEAFELALARLYGHEDPEREQQHIYGLCAVASFLDLPDLSTSCVANLTKSITANNVSEVTTFCSKFDYGRATTKVEEGCKSFLCREAFGMEFNQLDDIPEQTLAEVLSCDGLFIPSEWDRCLFIHSIYKKKVERMTEESQGDISEESIERLELIKEALNTGVHFCHLGGDKLFELEKYKDLNGKPLISREVLRDGLWLQLELKQKVSQSDGSHLGLDLHEWEQEDDITYYPVPYDEGLKVQKWTRFPPFRFSVQFDGISRLGDKDRQYSDTFWAAGSYWTVYIQRIKDQKKLGVYLHRGKLDSSGNLVHDSSSSTSNGGSLPVLSFSALTLDGSEETTNNNGAGAPRAHHGRNHSQSDNSDYEEEDEEQEHEEQVGEYFGRMAMESLRLATPERTMWPASPFGAASTFAREPNPPSTPLGGLALEDGRPNAEARRSSGHRSLHNWPHNGNSSNGSSGSGLSPQRNSTKSSSGGSGVSRTVDYIDKRQKIQAYFEVYTPSRRSSKTSLTKFSSPPDVFEFGQSWGWKSSSLGSNGESSLRFMITVGLI